jgi:hypothetical protein
MWYLGIQDKKLLCIIKEMLKAPIVMPNGRVIHPDKGTPQGGILSPLLSNIVLNELDWWISSQWETIPTRHKYDSVNPNGSPKRTNTYRALRKTKLKEMYIVRYADDFKIFCKTRSDAEKIFIATKQWLDSRLKLQVSEEKSKVVNLKKSYSEFLGFKLKAVPRRKSYVVRSHMCEKATERITTQLREQVKRVATPANLKDEAKEISLYNSMVMGMHNYYRIATGTSLDFKRIARRIDIVWKNRLKERIQKQGDLNGHKVIREKYGQSRQMRFVHGMPVIPVGFSQHKHPMCKKRSVNLYTEQGREEIHKKLGIDMGILLALMRMQEVNRSIEYMDNRISLYAAQNGKCAVTGVVLELNDIHCHHKIPVHLGGKDRYGNLIIVHVEVHRLIHAVRQKTIEKYLVGLELTESQLRKLNALREKAMLSPII